MECLLFSGFGHCIYNFYYIIRDRNCQHRSVKNKEGNIRGTLYTYFLKEVYFDTFMEVSSVDPS